MGVWIKSARGHTFHVRDGNTQEDPILEVGPEPVYFPNSIAGRFLGDREVEIVNGKAPPTKAEQKAQDKEQAALREARDAKQAKRKAAVAPPPSPVVEEPEAPESEDEDVPDPITPAVLG